jgi:hypothetical protein
MAEHSLFPSYVKVFYHSIYAQHTMTIPTRRWIPTPVSGANGSYLDWTGTPTDGEVMITALFTALQEICSADVNFDNFIIYDIPVEGDAPQPVSGGVIDLPGTVATPGWQKAVQTTFTLFDTDFNKMKLVVLDSASLNEFSKHLAGDFSGGELDVIAQLISEDNAWASRAGFRPSVPLSVTQTINDALRKQYGLS